MSASPRAFPDITAVVLAGGKSSRMGFDKALLRWRGTTLVEHAVDKLRTVFDRVLVAGGDAARFAQLGVPVIPDVLPGGGAVIGIHTALATATTPRVFVMACDAPFAEPALIAHLAGVAPDASWVLPHTDQGYEPLFAVYAQDCRPALEAIVASGRRRIMRLADYVPPHVVEEDQLRRFDPLLRSFVNLNTPDELAAHLPGAAEDSR